MNKMVNVDLPPKLEKYMPEVYDGVMETDALLDSENKLFDLMARQFNNLFDNQYVLTATEWGIARYEKMLNIIVDPVNESLEFRRERVLNRLTMNPPYTTPFLRSKLDEILGVGGYQLLLPTGDKPKSLIANDFSDFKKNSVDNAIVTVNKTFPIEVFKGGRNLLHSLRRGSVNSQNGDWVYSEDANSYLSDKFEYEVNKDYVMSFDFEGNSKNSIFLILYDINDNPICRTGGGIINNGYLYTPAHFATFFPDTGLTYEDARYCRFYLYGIGTIDNFPTLGSVVFKIELGSTPTEYSPAPEDGYDYDGANPGYHIQTSGGTSSIKYSTTTGGISFGENVYIDFKTFSFNDNLKVNMFRTDLKDVRIPKNVLTDYDEVGVINQEPSSNISIQFSYSAVETFDPLDFVSNAPAIYNKEPWPEDKEYVEPFTMIVESAADNFQWYEELAITIGKIKPANMVYITRPLITRELKTNESIRFSEMTWNYMLNGSWKLGEKPFVSLADKGVIKLPTTSSLQNKLFDILGGATSDAITHIMINGSYRIDTFETSHKTSVDSGTVELSYSIPAESNLGVINKVEVFNNQDKLSQSLIYVPLVQDVEMKHTISIKEGV